MRIPFFQVDAFTTRRFAGNPAAVMVLPGFPEDAAMQAISAENNLAETAFLVLQTDQYHLRWFTPTVEVPLCGHATLATAAVIMERLSPGLDEVTFQTASGALRVIRLGDGYVMDFPSRPSHKVPNSDEIAKALGEEPTEVQGNEHNYLAVFDHAKTVCNLAPDFAAISCLDRPGVIVTAPGEDGYDFVSRYFAPAKGIPEDPVTGGAHCMLAPYWAARLGKTKFHAYQASRRGGEISCQIVGDRVNLVGHCVFYLEGYAEI